MYTIRKSGIDYNGERIVNESVLHIVSVHEFSKTVFVLCQDTTFVLQNGQRVPLVYPRSPNAIASIVGRIDEDRVLVTLNYNTGCYVLSLTTFEFKFLDLRRAFTHISLSGQRIIAYGAPTATVYELFEGRAFELYSFDSEFRSSLTLLESGTRLLTTGMASEFHSVTATGIELTSRIDDDHFWRLPSPDGSRVVVFNRCVLVCYSSDGTRLSSDEGEKIALVHFRGNDPVVYRVADGTKTVTEHGRTTVVADDVIAIV